MSSTYYKVIQGDTFGLIARKVYGVETEAPRIERANPGVSTPLQVGIFLVIPTIPGAPTDRVTDTPAADPDEVAIRVDGVRFRYWETVQINRSLDSFDTIRITAPFSVDLPGFRETFVPFSFKEIDVTIGGVLLFTGTLVSVDPDITPERKSITASGYSKPGVLNDCTLPPSSFPNEFNGQNLREIATTLAGVFGLSVEFEDDPGPVFQKPISIEPGKKVLAFLADLAKQKNMVIGNTPAGALVFRRPITAGVPVAELRQGQSPLRSVSPRFSPQDYYSHISGIEPMYFGLSNPPFTIKNPLLTSVVRPFTFTVTDTESAGVAAAVESKIGRMFANAAAYDVGVATIRDETGNLWAPGAAVSLEAPDVMIYEKFVFTVRKASLTRDRKSERASLELIIPGTLGGLTPEVLPWGD